MPRRVHIIAPSRLHFGMFSFGQAGERQFGGVGAMIDRPGLELSMAWADRPRIGGPLAERAAVALGRLAETIGFKQPHVDVEILSAPPEHIGLGTGTQLSLALVAGLQALAGNALLDPLELAEHARRGERSAIGTYGFCRGGLLVEAGKHTGSGLSPLVSRVALDERWRFVLVRPRGERGLSGEVERETFASLPAVPAEVTKGLCHEALMHLVPAALDRRFDEFSESLYRFGFQAGLCFAARQGGAFASPRLTQLIEAMQSLDVRGVGQSSWGPTLFALFPDETAARDFCERLRARQAADDLELQITAPDNRGARIELEM